jgi:hypothetical protein
VLLGRAPSEDSLGEDASQQLHRWHHPRREAMRLGNLNIQAQFIVYSRVMS